MNDYIIARKQAKDFYDTLERNGFADLPCSRVFLFEGGMKKIALNGKHGQGKFVLVDDEDYEWLNQWRWYCCGNYAIRDVTIAKYKQKHIWMHRLINNTPDGADTDHKDLNTLNNQKYNLRKSTRSQNKMNMNSFKGARSQYKGVDWNSGDWRARIMVDGKSVFLGRFKDEKIASLAYDNAARILHDKFARLNNA